MCLLKRSDDMDKNELIDAIAFTSKLTKADSRKALDAIIRVTVSVLKRGGALALAGFGELEVHQHKKRSWKTRSGKVVTIPAHKTVFFHPGEDLKDCLNI